VAYFVVLPQHFPGRLSKTKRDLDSLCPGRDTNRTLSGFKSEALALGPNLPFLSALIVVRTGHI
jgi:hypothetical protein